MLSELNSTQKVVGAKQVKRALNDGRAAKVFLAADADPRVTEPLQRLAGESCTFPPVLETRLAGRIYG